MQGTQVRSSVQEDSTYGEAPEPMSHSYWAHARWSLCSTESEATAMISPARGLEGSPCLPQLEKANEQQQRPREAKNK